MSAVPHLLQFREQADDVLRTYYKGELPENTLELSALRTGLHEFFENKEQGIFDEDIADTWERIGLSKNHQGFIDFCRGYFHPKR